MTTTTLLRVFTILEATSPGVDISAEHDEIWIQADPSLVHPNDIKALEELGVDVDEDNENFHVNI